MAAPSPAFRLVEGWDFGSSRASISFVFLELNEDGIWTDTAGGMKVVRWPGTCDEDQAMSPEQLETSFAYSKRSTSSEIALALAHEYKHKTSFDKPIRFVKLLACDHIFRQATADVAAEDDQHLRTALGTFAHTLLGTALKQSLTRIKSSQGSLLKTIPAAIEAMFHRGVRQYIQDQISRAALAPTTVPEATVVAAVPSVFTMTERLRFGHGFALSLGDHAKEVQIIDEAHAAFIGMHILPFIRKNLKVGQVYCFCDAGGGTVDVTSLEILEVYPLRLQELGTPHSECIGFETMMLSFRAFLNTALAHFMNERQAMQTVKLMMPILRKAIVSDAQNTGDVWFRDPFFANELTDEDRTALEKSGFLLTHLPDTFLVLKNSRLRELQREFVDETYRLVDKHLAPLLTQLSQDGKDLTQVLMWGGACQVPFFQTAFEARFSSAAVLAKIKFFPVYCKSLLSHGAAFYGMHRDVIAVHGRSCLAGVMTTIPKGGLTCIPRAKCVHRTLLGQQTEEHIDNVAMWATGNTFVKCAGEVLNGNLLVDLCWTEKATSDPIRVFTSKPAAMVNWKENEIRLVASVLIPYTHTIKAEAFHIPYFVHIHWDRTDLVCKFRVPMDGKFIRATAIISMIKCFQEVRMGECYPEGRPNLLVYQPEYNLINSFDPTAQVIREPVLIEAPTGPLNGLQIDENKMRIDQ